MSNIKDMDKKRSGIKEIAKLAGVSIATVSRTLNGNKNVNPELSAKVLEIAESLGYQPSLAARYMRSNKAGLLGIVVPDLSLTYFSNIVNGAVDKAREYDQMVVVGTVEGKTGIEIQYLKKLSGYMLDGLIHCPVGADTLPSHADLRKIPMVFAGRRHVIQGFSHINTDDENAGYLAARYLIKLGRTKIGYFAGFWESPPFSDYDQLISAIDSPLSGSFSSLDRLKGYRRALSESGHEMEGDKMVCCGFDAESGYHAAGELIGRLNEIDALMVPNCIVARGVFRFLQEQGLKVPADISIISMDDNMGMGELLEVPVTAIVHDMYSVGVQAVEILNRRIQGESAGDKTIAVKLQIRQSTTQKP